MSNSLRRLTLLAASASLLAACATVPSAPLALSDNPATVSALASEVAIPHQTFRLDNGLTVIVHEDRKAPVVAVSTWYNVGSKDEPAGKTGFAHLFEHLMFYGSDNIREGIVPFLEKVGATDFNGTTWYDRTNYYETVPRANLERSLFMESDRMGYLLAAVDQPRLDNQRGVVQNEKRQRDNNPGGLVDYATMEALFPEGHPYRHSTIGSMADLDAASLADVKNWFVERYGPNNAIVSLAGDINVDEARALMTKYFAAIPRGPVNTPAAAPVPTLAAPKSLVLKDRVAAVEVQRLWAVPGVQSADLPALDLGMSVFGGLASSRLDQILVRGEKLAISASAGVQPFHRIGLVEISATVKPGVDPAVVERRLDQLITQYLAEGPTEDELRRAAMVNVAGRIRGLEKVGDGSGKASTLAEGLLYNGDSDFYRRELQNYGLVTPADVRAVTAKWLARPVVNVRLEPGERPAYVETKATAKPMSAKVADVVTVSVKRDVPPVGAPLPLDFPDVTHTALSNGIRVHYVQRSAVPLTQLALSFDAGFSADAPSARGLQNMVLNLLDEGTATMTGQQLAEEEERLGASIATGGSADRSSVTMSALSANLVPSLKLMSDIVVNPAFAPDEIERNRTQLVTSVAQARTSPGAMATRAMPGLIYGANHPYATTGLGDEAAIKGFTRADLLAFKDRWLRPDNGQLFIVSNLPLATVMPLLERQFGQWQAPATPRGVKTFSAVPAASRSPRIVLIDRPNSPQSFIYAGEVTSIDPRADNTAISAGSDVLGGISGRLALDLREDKGWSYGAYGGASMNLAAVPYLVQAPVQADRTGDSVAAILQHFRDITGGKGVTTSELDRAVTTSIGELPGRFETGASVLGAMQANALLGRPDNYYELISDRYRALDIAGVNQVLKSRINPDAFVFVVVGDAAKVRPQLAKLGLPIEQIQPR
ncbi:MAG: insulinase family protein [Sphingomonas bacterium]|nr:insulinase family protein [Sphingomonas bacterium]